MERGEHDGGDDGDDDDDDFVGDLEGLFCTYDRELGYEDEGSEFVTLADHREEVFSLRCHVFAEAATEEDNSGGGDDGVGHGSVAAAAEEAASGLRCYELRIHQDLALRQRVIEDDEQRALLSETERETATGAVVWNAGVVLGKLLQWQAREIPTQSRGAAIFTCCVIRVTTYRTCCAGAPRAA